MKTKLNSKLILSAIVLVFAGKESAAQWSIIPTGIPGSIEEIIAPSADTVFFKAEKLYRTFNGGDSFNTLKVPNVNKVTHVYFLNGKSGYVSASNISTHENEIFFTPNSGDDWIRVTPPQKMDLVENIAFSDENTGIVMLTPQSNHREGHYHFTKDRGQTWELVGPLVGYYLKDAAFKGRTGYAIAHTFESNIPDQVMKSEDGGRTWNVAYNPKDSVNTFQGIQVISENEAIAFLNDIQNLQANIYHTTNGGISWNKKIFSGQVLSMSFGSGMNGLIIDDNGIIFRTTNGGESWEEDRPADDKILSIEAVSSVAYAGGAQGTLIKRTAIDNVDEVMKEVEAGTAFPNPSGGSVVIPTDLFGSLLFIEVKDISGKLVGQQEIQGYHDVIQLNELPKGVLFISVTDEFNQYKIFKVVVE